MRPIRPSFTPRSASTHRCCEYATEERKPHTPSNHIHEGKPEIPPKVVEEYRLVKHTVRAATL